MVTSTSHQNGENGSWTRPKNHGLNRFTLPGGCIFSSPCCVLCQPMRQTKLPTAAPVPRRRKMHPRTKQFGWRDGGSFQTMEEESLGHTGEILRNSGTIATYEDIFFYFLGNLRRHWDILGHIEKFGETLGRPTDLAHFRTDTLGIHLPYGPCGSVTSIYLSISGRMDFPGIFREFSVNLQEFPSISKVFVSTGPPKSPNVSRL